MTRHAGCLAVLAITMVMTSAPAAAGPSGRVLHTYHQNQRVRRALDPGIQNGLQPSSSNGEEAYFETIELHRVPDPQYEQLSLMGLAGLEAVLRASPVPVFSVSDQQSGSGVGVLFREANFWTSYGRYVMIAASICLLQTVLIVTLLLERASRKRAERSLRDSEVALRASAQQVKDLAGRLIAAQEDERRRIAIELHDDVSQGLALLAIELDQLHQSSATTRTGSVGTSTVAARIADITSSVSALAIRLHPSRLEALGLADAVRRLCHDVSSAHRIQVEFQNRALPPKLAPDVALCVYRIAQEALHNVAKHSGAKRASVDLSAIDNNLVLKVTDSGKGFDTQGPAAHGLGLLSIRDRVTFLKGRLDIQSAPGAGTELATHIPIRTEALVSTRASSVHI